MSEAKFKKATEIVQGMPKDGPVQPTQDQQLTFYKYFKQGTWIHNRDSRPMRLGTIGDVNTARPGMLDFTGKAKWDAWNSIKGTSKEEAWAKYVDALLEILKKSDSEESKKWVAEIEAA